MKWTIGKKYLRRNGGLAEYIGIEHGMHWFEHMDLTSIAKKHRFVHYLNGRFANGLFMSAEDAAAAKPFDIVTDDTNVTTGLGGGAGRIDLGDGDEMLITHRPDGGIGNITINV